MPQTELEITQDLVEALDKHFVSMLTTPEPVAILAAYLDSLAKSYGLSESGKNDEDPLQRVDLPPRAGALVNHYLADGAALIEVDALRDRLYDVFVELSRNPSARKELNKNTPLTDQGLLQLAQIYWNLEGNDHRRLLPIRPGTITTLDKPMHADIPAPQANKDFATMPWTARVNLKGSYKSSGQGFRKQGVRLAVLTAKHIIDGNSLAPPSLGNADLRRTENAAGSLHVSIVWPDSGRPGAAEHGTVVVEGSAAPTSMPTITSRARANHAIDSFEQDLRQSIERFLLGRLLPEEVFGPEYDKLCTRQASTDVSETGALTPSLYPQEAYDVLLRHSAALPDELADILRFNLAALDNFIPLRNRVMRVRPLQPDDLDDTETFVGRFRSPYFPKTKQALVQLRSDSRWQPRVRTGPTSTERILHNLPSPEFDETGLLGRERQIKEIVRLLKRRREPITLTGEGGIGKTALALEVCYRLADDPEPPFEAILWASLKSKQLTPAGVKELSNSIRDIAGVTRALGQRIDQTFQGSVGELAAALGEMTTLVVIDNLETNLGDDVVDLYDTLPETVTFLFTSRRGVGRIERPVPVGPLEEESAEQLFRKFARSRGQSELADLPPAVLDDRLRQLRNSPLAIRWYILSLEAGKTPTDTLRNQDELLRFCVGNVVDDLSTDERLLLDVLRVLDRPVSFDELAVISEMDIGTLRRGAESLRQASLLVHSHLADGDESGAIALSSTARDFLPTVPESEVMENVIRRETAYNQDRENERRWIADRGRYFDANVIFERSPRDEPVAHLLHRALRESKSGHPEAASATIARARDINPGYFEVDRIDAFFASIRKETARATTLYRSALNNCRTDEERCWVGYFYASHLARTAFDIPAAIRLAEESHAFFNTYDTAHHLGNFYFWDNRFDDGRRLIEWAIEQAPTTEFRRKATTSLVECFRQWSDADLTAGLPPASLAHALRGVALGIELHDSGSTDERLIRSIMRAAVAALKAVRRMAELGPEEERQLANALQRLSGDDGFLVTDSWRYLEYAVSSLTDEMRSRLAPGFRATTIDAVPKGRVRGTVKNVGQKYGFITLPEFPDNVFFQAGWLLPPMRIEDLEVGAPVEFTPSKNDKGQDQAMDVILVGRDVNTASVDSQ